MKRIRPLQRSEDGDLANSASASSQPAGGEERSANTDLSFSASGQSGLASANRARVAASIFAPLDARSSTTGSALLPAIQRFRSTRTSGSSSMSIPLSPSPQPSPARGEGVK